ncbi:MAG: glucosamine 6-phosphate synthetase, partial [Ruminococcus sp.]|nr:glucosamine 6-phosphate synthetase [Ruminococcus sp.]
AVHGDILRIDSNGLLSRSEFEETDYKYVPWYGLPYDDDYEDEELYTSHEQLLFDICNYYGIDKYDIMLLLDYGYTADEIEDMLMDYDLLTDAVKSIKEFF